MTSIGQLRREAQGALDAATQPWKQDRQRGYLQALDDVEAVLDERRGVATQERLDIVDDMLEQFAKLAQDNILRGSVNSFTLRDLVAAAQRRLAKTVDRETR